MPPVTRRQLKKVEPYTKENCLTKRRKALLDVNASKTVATSNVKKSSERIFKNGNIAKTETVKLKNEVSKLDSIVKLEVKPEALSITKEVLRSSINSSTSSLYLSAHEDITDFKAPEDLPKLEVKPGALSITKEVLRSSINSSKCSSLYLSHHEDITDFKVPEDVPSDTTQSNSPTENNHSELYHSATHERSIDSANVDEIFEIDETYWSDYIFVGCYAKDIFNYLRKREDMFEVTDYINDQSELTPRHRAIVVDWLVTIQDELELNHEVLYMAVRFIDLYLMKNELPKSKFQLLASAALLLSIKVDERGLGFPNMLVKQSNYIFTEEELLVTERELVKSLNCDINVPLSYVFLRRFARCMKCQMVLLTLARYILEESLLEYKFVILKESLKAAAALFLALKMFSKVVDAKDFIKYTGYSVNDIKNTVIELNNLLHKPKSDLNSVKQKYSHKIFFEVANRSPLKNSQLSFD